MTYGTGGRRVEREEREEREEEEEEREPQRDEGNGRMCVAVVKVEKVSCPLPQGPARQGIIDHQRRRE